MYKLYMMNILGLLLLKNPQMINLQDDQGRTPLMIVSEFNNLNLFKHLLGLPYIKLATQDIHGNTVLHYITRQIKTPLDDFDTNLIERILEKNPALADIKNKKGQGPGNIYITHSSVHDFIKLKKSGWFRRHKNTNTRTNREGNKNKTKKHRR